MKAPSPLNKNPIPAPDQISGVSASGPQTKRKTTVRANLTALVLLVLLGFVLGPVPMLVMGLGLGGVYIWAKARKQARQDAKSL